MNGGNIVSSVDSQFGHIFTVGVNREEACRRMSRLISHTLINGEVSTTLPFLRQIIDTRVFRDNKHTTLWIQHDMFSSQLSLRNSVSYSTHAGLSDMDTSPIYDYEPHDVAWIFGLFAQGWWRLCAHRTMAFTRQENGHMVEIPTSVCVGIEVNKSMVEGKVYLENQDLTEWNKLYVLLDSNSKQLNAEICVVHSNVILIRFIEKQVRIQLVSHEKSYNSFSIKVGYKGVSFAQSQDPNKVYSPVTGKVVRIVNEYCVEIEAMKMVFPIKASFPVDFFVTEGTNVKEGQCLGQNVELFEANTSMNTSTLPSIPDWMYTTITSKEPQKNSVVLPKISPLSTHEILQTLVWDSLVRISDSKTMTRETCTSDSQLFEDDVGVQGFLLDGDLPVVVISHDPKNPSFGVKESVNFMEASTYARTHKIPRIYLCRTMGARLDYNPEIVKHMYIENDEVYITREGYTQWSNKIVIDSEYRVKRIKNMAIETLDGCQKLQVKHH